MILEGDQISFRQCTFRIAETDGLLEHWYEHRDVGIICDICSVNRSKNILRSLTLRNNTGQVTSFVRRNTSERK